MDTRTDTTNLREKAEQAARLVERNPGERWAHADLREFKAWQETASPHAYLDLLDERDALQARVDEARQLLFDAHVRANYVQAGLLSTVTGEVFAALTPRKEKNR